jgi:hypothetical protein
MKPLGIGPLVLLALAASCSAADMATPNADPFAGSYTLATVGKVSIPGTVAVVPSTGGSTFVGSGSLVFLDARHLVFSQMLQVRDSSTSSPVASAQVDTFEIGRLPTQGFVLQPGNASDTIAVITVPQAGRLAWDFRGIGSFGTYAFVR